MKLEVGKFYKSRNGCKWKCVHEYRRKSEYSFFCVELGMDDCESFTDNGLFLASGIQHQNDLISEWVEPVVHEFEISLVRNKHNERVDAISGSFSKYHYELIARKTITFTEGEGL